MRELSLHIMDIMENGISAGGTLIALTVAESGRENRLRITVKDNGRGIPSHLLEDVTRPFYTTRTTRRVGLGLSLFREAARRCAGEMEIRSEAGRGTEVSASFQLDHLDLAPLGDMAGSLTTLIMGNPDVEFVYTHEVDGRVFRLDTREVKKDLEGVPIQHPEVILALAGMIRESLAELRSAGSR